MHGLCCLGNRLLRLPLIWTDAFTATEFKIGFIFLMQMQPKGGNKAKNRVVPSPPPLDFSSIIPLFSQSVCV